MARPYRKRAIRNLYSAGTGAAKLGSKTIVGLSRWVVTDHSGMGTTISNMPKMGFVDSVRYGITYLIGYLIFTIIGAVLTEGGFSYEVQREVDFRDSIGKL